MHRGINKSYLCLQDWIHRNWVLGLSKSKSKIQIAKYPLCVICCFQFLSQSSKSIFEIGLRYKYEIGVLATFAWVVSISSNRCRFSRGFQWTCWCHVCREKNHPRLTKDEAVVFPVSACTIPKTLSSTVSVTSTNKKWENAKGCLYMKGWWPRNLYLK